MPNNLLFNLLDIIDKEEMKDFGRYLEGKYSGRKKIHQLHKYLIKSHSKYGVARMRNNRVAKSAFTKPITEATLQNRYTELGNILKEYLSFRELEEHEFLKDYLRIRYFEKKNRKDLFSEQIAATQKRINPLLNEEENKEGIDGFYFLKSMLLHHLRYFHSNCNTFILDEMNEEVQLALADLNHFNKLLTLYYQTEILNRERILKTNLPFQLESDDNYKLLYQLYQYKYELLKQPSDSTFQDLRNLLFSNLEKLNNQERSLTLTSLCNFLTNSIKQGNIAHLETLFQLYKDSYDKEFLIVNGQLVSYHYHNIIGVASKLGEDDWLDKFLINYYTCLGHNDQTQFLKLGNAQKKFRAGAYDEATEELKDIVKYENSFYELRAKAIILRCYYMQEKPERFILSYHHSFLTKVGRIIDMNPIFIEGYKNFLSYFIKVYLNKKDKAMLIQQIKSEKNLQCRLWLLEVLGEKKNEKPSEDDFFGAINQGNLL